MIIKEILLLKLKKDIKALKIFQLI